MTGSRVSGSVVIQVPRQDRARAAPATDLCSHNARLRPRRKEARSRRPILTPGAAGCLLAVAFLTKGRSRCIRYALRSPGGERGANFHGDAKCGPAWGTPEWQRGRGFRHRDGRSGPTSSNLLQALGPICSCCSARTPCALSSVQRAPRASSRLASFEASPSSDRCSGGTSLCRRSPSF